MDSRKVSDFGIKRSQFVELPAVGADAVFKNCVADSLCLESVDGRLHVSRIVVGPEFFDGFVHQFFDAFVSGSLVAGLFEDFDEAIADHVACGLLGSFLFSRNFGGFPLFLTHFRLDLFDLLDNRTVDFLGEFECIQEHFFGNKVGSRFDHHRGIACTGNHEFEVAGLQFLVRWVYYEFVLDQADHARPYRVVECDIGYCERR